MAYTQADLDSLRAAVINEHLEVEYNGRRVRFRSIAELRSAIEIVKGELAAATAASSRTGPYRFTFTTQRGD